MSRGAKRIVTAVFAFMFLAVAVVFSLILFSNRSLSLFGTDDEKLAKLGQDAEQEDETIPYDSPLAQVVDAKYLWEYGWQAVAEEMPSEVTEPTTETTTVPVPETAYEAVTNWKGELVTDVYGQPVTRVREYFTDYQYQFMTDVNGNIARDEEGNIVTDAIAVTRPTQAPPLTMQDGHGNIVTKPNGEPVTKVAKSTVYVTNPSSVGATYRGEGISDGDMYVGVRVIIDGDYDVASNGLMTVGMTYKVDKKLHIKSLTYNIDKLTCRVSKDEYYTGMVKLAKENDKMVITLYIPDSAQIPTDQMRLFNASSTLGTFRDSNGDYLDGFSVSVL